MSPLPPSGPNPGPSPTPAPSPTPPPRRADAAAGTARPSGAGAADLICRGALVVVRRGGGWCSARPCRRRVRGVAWRASMARSAGWWRRRSRCGSAWCRDRAGLLRPRGGLRAPFGPEPKRQRCIVVRREPKCTVDPLNGSLGAYANPKLPLTDPFGPEPRPRTRRAAQPHHQRRHRRQRCSPSMPSQPTPRSPSNTAALNTTNRRAAAHHDRTRATAKRPYPRRINRPTAAISSSVFSAFAPSSGAPITQWLACWSSSPSATLSSAAWTALIWVRTSMQ